MARKKHSEAREARKFGVILTILLVALGAFSFWRGHPVRAGVLAGLAIPALLLPFAAPALWLVLFRQWMKLAHALSWVMTRVILTVFYYLVLSPMALVMRLFGRRPLDNAWKDGKATYWIDKSENEFTVERYSKQY